MDSDASPFLSKVDGLDSFSESSEEYPTNEDIENARKLAPRPHKRLCYATARVIVILFAVWGLLVTLLAIACAAFPSWHPFRQSDVYRPETLKPGLNACLCGHTVEEALALDCAYDSLATAWLPKECRDDELTDKFDRAGPGGHWDYYVDENGTTPITSKSEIAALGPQGGSFWASRDWHIAHCTFYWQKYKRMGKTGTIMEARFDTLHHVEHCGALILKGKPDYFFLIEVPVRMNGSFDENPRDSRIGGKIPAHLFHVVNAISNLTKDIRF
ncbi:hypothetical protein GGR51DRAFT_551573 [Nemania sp. FL0031]|nr:hypothetical protein GGR51DRAFT_551573 [Nemania sp. FL0031]